MGTWAGAVAPRARAPRGMEFAQWLLTPRSTKYAWLIKRHAGQAGGGGGAAAKPPPLTRLLRLCSRSGREGAGTAPSFPLLAPIM